MARASGSTGSTGIGRSQQGVFRTQFIELSKLSWEYSLPKSQVDQSRVIAADRCVLCVLVVVGGGGGGSGVVADGLVSVRWCRWDDWA